MIIVTRIRMGGSNIKPHITMIYERDEDASLVSDATHYPFVLHAGVGGNELQLFLSKEEANTLAFQLNAQLQESDKNGLENL